MISPRSTSCGSRRCAGAAGSTSTYKCSELGVSDHESRSGDFSGFCLSDEDCPVREVTSECLVGTVIDEVFLHVGGGTTPIVRLDAAGNGTALPNTLSGTLALNVNGEAFATTGPALGASTQISVDWVQGKVHIFDWTSQGGLDTVTRIVADIQNYPPVARVEDDQTVLCTSRAGADVTLRGTYLDLDGFTDILTAGWWQGFASAAAGGGRPFAPATITPVVAPHGTSVYTFQVRDRSLQEDVKSTRVTVVNSAPVAVVQAQAVVECSSPSATPVIFSAADSFDVDPWRLSTRHRPHWRTSCMGGPFVSGRPHTSTW